LVPISSGADLKREEASSRSCYGFGGYRTHRDPVGWYTDLVLQGNLYDSIGATEEIYGRLGAR